MKLSLTQRLSLVFALLLLVCCGTSVWLQVRSNRMHQQVVVQGLSRGLAEHIARSTQLMDTGGLNSAAVRNLFSQLMVVNPSVEVYLLDSSGRITGYDAPADRLRRKRVSLAPIRRLLAGDSLPIMGDDPRSAHGKKVFSAAPLRVDGRDAGYIYVVLLGEARDQLAAQSATSAALRTALWAIGLVALLCLIAGLTAFTLITRPLRRLTQTVRNFDLDGSPSAWPAAKEVPDQNGNRDEISLLDNAFGHMATRLGDQWRALTRQDQDRRELIATISHDLRTPLASLHGYLETLSLKDATLEPSERRRYLGIALDQSRKVGALAQSLFELARLEYGFVEPEPESFSLTDLIQDIFQKFELLSQRNIELKATFTPPLPPVYADLGLMERVLTNLLENALAHTPQGGLVEVLLAQQDEAVAITVADTGPGVPLELRADLFQKPVSIGGARRSGGLGLRIATRILQLHGGEIQLVDLPERGAAFRFFLPLDW